MITQRHQDEFLGRLNPNAVTLPLHHAEGRENLLLNAEGRLMGRRWSTREGFPCQMQRVTERSKAMQRLLVVWRLQDIC